MAFLEVAVLPLRAVQALFSLIVLGLSAYIVDVHTSPWGSWSPHSVNFMLFTAVWTLLAVAYLVLAPSRFPRAAHKFAILGVEALTMLFWFAAWVAVAALWGDWLKPARTGTVWSTGVAAIIFSAFIWYVAPYLRLSMGGDSNTDAGLPLLRPRFLRHYTFATHRGAIPHRRRRCRAYRCTRSRMVERRMILRLRPVDLIVWFSLLFSSCSGQIVTGQRGVCDSDIPPVPVGIIAASNETISHIFNHASTTSFARSFPGLSQIGTKCVAVC